MIQSRRRSIKKLGVYLTLTTSLYSGAVMATEIHSPPVLPQGGVVVDGSAAITQPSPENLHVAQATNQVIIHWDSFSIGRGGHVHFQQPSPDAVALNRVVGAKMSEIAGSLTATGRVILVNPNGVVMDKGATIDTGSFVASAHGISNEDFLKGQYHFSALEGGEGRSVVNKGTITVQEKGLVALVGPHVANDGVIQANSGTVMLAAGDKVTLVDVVDPHGDGLLKFAVVERPVSKTPRDLEGKPAQELVKNTGKILADGGAVLLTADALEGIVKNVVNNEGVISAASTHVEKGGTIVLAAGPTGSVTSGGVLDASGAVHGGDVGVFGERVTVTGDILAEGREKGGLILAGGNLKGGSGEGQTLVAPYAAKTTVVTETAKLSVKSPEGDAGKIIVWSDKETAFRGAPDATGGKRGGFMEVSAKEASEGREFIFEPKNKNYLIGGEKPGDLLLDPKNIQIDAKGTGLLTEVNAFASGPAGALDKNAETVSVDAATLVASGANVTLQAHNDISVNQALDLSHNNDAESVFGVIITKPTEKKNFTLTLEAGRSVIFHQLVKMHSTGTLNVRANVAGASSNRDMGHGNIVIHSPIETGVLDLNINPVGGTPGDISQKTGSLLNVHDTLTVSTPGDAVLGQNTNTISKLGASNAAALSLVTGTNPLTITGAVTTTGRLTITTQNQDLILDPGAASPLSANRSMTLKAGTGVLNLNSNAITAGQTGVNSSLTLTGSALQNAGGVIKTPKLKVTIGGPVQLDNAANEIGKVKNSQSQGPFAVTSMGKAVGGVTSFAVRNIDTTGAGASAAGGNIDVTYPHGVNFTDSGGHRLGTRGGAVTTTVTGGAPAVPVPAVAPPPVVGHGAPPPPPLPLGGRIIVRHIPVVGHGAPPLPVVAAPLSSQSFSPTARVLEFFGPSASAEQKSLASAVVHNEVPMASSYAVENLAQNAEMTVKDPVISYDRREVGTLVLTTGSEMLDFSKNPLFEVIPVGPAASVGSTESPILSKVRVEPVFGNQIQISGEQGQIQGSGKQDQVSGEPEGATTAKTKRLKGQR